MSRMLTAIQDILRKNKEISVISFDLFDTVLFRMVKEPADVFIRTGEIALADKVLPEYVTPEMYKNIRVEAENKARQKKKDGMSNTTEVTLEEIIQCIPDGISNNKQQLVLLELLSEQQICYLNPDMRELVLFLKGWKTDKKKVIITSDMYLSAEQEKKLLKVCDLEDMEIFDQIIVSNEHFCTKAQGDLYQYILEKFQIRPENLLHIGDNYMADIVIPQNLGINTLYYDALYSGNYIELQMEEMGYGSLAPEILSLRKYAAYESGNLSKEYQKWFQIGAMILGPFMADMAEWILDTAEKEDIYYIYPLMREGLLFSRLLVQAAEYRKEEFYIEPMYISRKSVFLPSMGKYDKEFVEQLFLEKNGTIGEFLELFGIFIYNEEIQEILSEDMKQFRKRCFVEGSREKKIYQLLYNMETIKNVENLIEKNRKDIVSYLKNDLDLKTNYITVDIGYKGTMQKALETILNKELSEINYKGIHLLGFGTKSYLECIFQNIDIRAYFSYGDDEKIAEQIVRNAYLLEQLLMAPCGTTEGYRDGKPVLEESSEIPEKQKKWIKYCQYGMLYYQKYFLYLKYKQKKELFLKYEKDELVDIIIRMLYYPTAAEGNALGEISYDENFGVNRIEKMWPEKMIETMKKSEINKFLNDIVPGQVKWPEGLIARTEPGYFFDKLASKNHSFYENSALKIIQKVRGKKVDKVVIVGAGTAGRTLKHYFELYGIGVEAFTDNNKKLWGTTVENIPVKTLEDSFETDNFVIGSFAFAEELVRQVKEQRGECVNIFCA